MVKVDARGDACPLPVVKAKKAIAELNGAGEVEILVDNEIAVQNLTKMAQQKGLVYSAEKLAEREYSVRFTVGETTPRISRFFYQLLGTCIHRYKDIVCIRFGRMLFHTVCVFRIGICCDMFAYTHIRICTLSSFRNFLIMILIRIYSYRRGCFRNNQINSLM